jgi:glutathione S-transferase
MTELFFAPGACSFVPHVALQRIQQSKGRAFTATMVKLHKAENHSPEYLAMNPDGQVPVLRDEGQVITQIVAICDYLDRSAPELELLPARSSERSQALSKLLWLNNTVHPTFTQFFMPAKFSDDQLVQAALKPFAARKFRSQLERIQAELPDTGSWGRSGLDGVGFLDAYAVVLWRWGGFIGVEPSSMPGYKAFVERMAEQAPIAQAMAFERVQLHTYKPATEA